MNKSILRNLIVKCKLLILIALCSWQKLNAQDSLLFIGNSLTYYNDMPEMFSEICSNLKINVYVECSARPGYSLTNHVSSYVYKKRGFNVNSPPNNRILKIKYKVDTLKPILPTTISLIKENNFDQVIIQEQPNYLFNETLRDSLSFPALDSLKYHSGQESKFYISSLYTGRGLEKSCLTVKKCSTGGCDFVYYCPPEFKSYGQLCDSLNSYAENMALKVNGKVLPITDVFEFFRLNLPELSLYKQGNHPTKEASFILASVYVACIYGKRDFEQFCIKKRIKRRDEVLTVLTSFFESYDSVN